MNKQKLGKGLMVFFISTLVALICSLFVFFNFRAYGMYYASQYYGSDAYYNILLENLKGGFQVANEKKSYKNDFDISSPDKGKKRISFLEDDGVFMTMQDDDAPSLITVLASSDQRSYFYEYIKDSQLHFYRGDTSLSDPNTPNERKKFLKEDNANFEYYVSQYIDIQLKAIGKPRINLQWIYNIVQMI